MVWGNPVRYTSLVHYQNHTPHWYMFVVSGSIWLIVCNIFSCLIKRQLRRLPFVRDLDAQENDHAESKKNKWASKNRKHLCWIHSYCCTVPLPYPTKGTTWDPFCRFHRSLKILETPTLPPTKQFAVLSSEINNTMAVKKYRHCFGD